MSENTITRAMQRVPRRRPRGVRSRPSILIASAVLAVIVIACALAPLIAPYPPNESDLTAVLQTPSAAHWLGTDDLGRDTLSRMLWGGRTSLMHALIVVVVSLAVAVPVGLLSGYLGGRFDRGVMLAVEVGMAVPAMILVLVVLSVFQDVYVIALIALAVLMAPPVVRNIRGFVISIRGELFVDAAIVSGVPTRTIISRHVLRRVFGPLLVQATMITMMSIQMTVALAWLGYGALPPDPTWGNLVASGTSALSRSGWLLGVSGGTVAVVVLCLGVLGDGIRDATVGTWSTVTSPDGGAVRRARRRLPVSAGRAPAAQPAGALLSVRDLSIAYLVDDEEKTVVHGVGFDVAPGESVGLVGESGCGKTTLARSLMRMGGRITGGSVVFAGEDVLALGGTRLGDYRGGAAGYISQEPSAALDPVMRVGHLLAEVVRRHEPGLARDAVDARVLDLLRMVRLPDPERVSSLYPFEMSGGMAQRVCIARALAGRPRLLIADEATTALDVIVQSEILSLLHTLQAETGMALIVVTHDWGVVHELCDRVLVMRNGRFVEEGTVSDVVTAPAHPYTRALLACRVGRDTPRDADLPTVPSMSDADPLAMTGPEEAAHV